MLGKRQRGSTSRRFVSPPVFSESPGSHVALYDQDLEIALRAVTTKEVVVSRGRGDGAEQQLLEHTSAQAHSGSVALRFAFACGAEGASHESTAPPPRFALYAADSIAPLPQYDSSQTAAEQAAADAAYATAALLASNCVCRENLHALLDDIKHCALSSSACETGPAARAVHVRNIIVVQEKTVTASYMLIAVPLSADCASPRVESASGTPATEPSGMWRRYRVLRSELFQPWAWPLLSALLFAATQCPEPSVHVDFRDQTVALENVFDFLLGFGSISTSAEADAELRRTGSADEILPLLFDRKALIEIQSDGRGRIHASMATALSDVSRHVRLNAKRTFFALCCYFVCVCVRVYKSLQETPLSLFGESDDSSLHDQPTAASMLALSPAPQSQREPSEPGSAPQTSRHSSPTSVLGAGDGENSLENVPASHLHPETPVARSTNHSIAPQSASFALLQLSPLPLMEAHGGDDSQIVSLSQHAPSSAPHDIPNLSPAHHTASPLSARATPRQSSALHFHTHFSVSQTPGDPRAPQTGSFVLQHDSLHLSPQSNAAASVALAAQQVPALEPISFENADISPRHDTNRENAADAMHGPVDLLCPPRFGDFSLLLQRVKRAFEGTAELKSSSSGPVDDFKSLLNEAINGCSDGSDDEQSLSIILFDICVQVDDTVLEECIRIHGDVVREKCDAILRVGPSL